MDKYIGKRLDGRYEIREIIGVGGMAVVYKAYDTIESRIVAIKILKDEYATNEDFVRRFKNESKAIAVLAHPNIVKVYDVSFGDLIQYIVMEHIEGITLKQYIEAHGTVNWKDSVNIVMQILRALQHAHDKGIIHRDVKPQNIMLTSDNVIKVTDFGIARFARSDHKTMTDKAIGSVHYISPEQARSEITDEKADIYSLGVIMYEMLSGILPFEADSAVIVAMMQLQNEAKPLRDINPAIPLGLAQITMNAMQKDIVRRYQTAAEMLCDLETFRRDPNATFEKRYFVDNDPTKFVDNSNQKTDKVKPEVKKTKKSFPWVPVLTGIMVGVAILVAVIIVYSALNKFAPTTGTQCPDFVGMNVNDIEKKYSTKDYNFVIKYEESGVYEVGEVIRQDPNPKTVVKKKDPVTLYVATDDELVTVPDVAHNTKSSAKSILRNAGFVDFVTEEIYDDVVDEGKVVKTKPMAKSKVPASEEITIYISKGKEIIYSTVPNVIGCDEASAEALLKKEGLKLGEVKRKISTHPKGFVISQSVDEDEQVEEGTVIDLVVSSGTNAQSYSMDIKIDVPDDCALEWGYMYVQYDDRSGQTEIMYFPDADVCSFTITSVAKTCDVLVKIIDEDEIEEYDYQKIRVDFKEKSFEVIEKYNKYPKE